MDSAGSGTSRDNVKCPRALPQFSDLCSMPATAAAIAAIAAADNRNTQSQGIETTAQLPYLQEPSTNPFNKLFISGSIPTWEMRQGRDKQLLNQIINVPSYSQNNGTLGMQSSSLCLLNSLFPWQTDIVKQESDIQSKEKNLRQSEILMKQPQTVLDCLQKLPSDVSLRDLLELCAEVKKEKTQEEKVEHMQTNILNIPNIRNIYLQNSNNFANSDQMTVTVNPNDLTLQNEQEIENSIQNSIQNVLKVEQQVQTDLPRKSKFRAKFGEIKTTVYDGITFYNCPECSVASTSRAEVEQHVQNHVQERKYQCKECGAMLKRKEHLDQHMRGHSNERPFKCDVCHKAFKRNEHLTRHTVIHSGNKDFLCKYCHKAFSRKDHLHKHLQTHFGTRKNKTKEDSYYGDQKDTTRVFDIDTGLMPKQEVSYVLKDSCLLKQESHFLQHMQNSKNAGLLHTFASLKEHVMKDVNISEQTENSDMNENARYLMPS